jgi:hypothetical protein
MRLARTDAGVVVAALEGVFILDGKQTRQVLPACSAGW